MNAAERKIARLITAYRKTDPVAADALADLARLNLTPEQWGAIARLFAVGQDAR